MMFRWMWMTFCMCMRVHLVLLLRMLAMLWMMVMRLMSGHVGEGIDDVDGNVADADVTIILITVIHNIMNIHTNMTRP